MSARDSKQKPMKRLATLDDNLLVKKFCFKRSGQETLQQNEPVDAPCCRCRLNVLQDHLSGISNSDK